MLYQLGVVQTQGFFPALAALYLHCKKRFATFPSPAGMSLAKLSLGIIKLFPPGKSLTFFYSVGQYKLSSSQPFLTYVELAGRLQPLSHQKKYNEEGRSSWHPSRHMPRTLPPSTLPSCRLCFLHSWHTRLKKK
jgi:hypothetical protein